MDKSEYNLKIEELKAAMHAHDFEKAVDVADSLEIKKIRDNNLLSLIADAYELTGDNEQAKKILLMAYENTNAGRQLAYRLCLISIKLKEPDEANEFYQDFIEMAPRDTARYILKYKMAKAENKPVEELIKILEDYVNIDMEEKWAFELAKLYDIAGESEKCVNMCDEICLWFAEGKYVLKAMDLKKKYESLTSTQQDNYNRKKEDNAGDKVEEEVSSQELMDKIIGKTPIKSRIDEAVKEANESKPEIEEIMAQEVKEFNPEEDKTHNDIEGAAIDGNNSTHPQDVEEITIPEINDEINEAASEEPVENNEAKVDESEKENAVNKPDKEKKRVKLKPFSVKPKKAESIEKPLKEDEKNEVSANANVPLEEDKDFKLINPDDAYAIEEIAEDTVEPLDMEFNEDMDMKSVEKKEDILNVDDVEDILHQLQARGILKAETVNSAVSIIENVRETKKEHKEEKSVEKNVSTLDRWQEDNVEVEQQPLDMERNPVEDEALDSENNDTSQVNIPDLEETPEIDIEKIAESLPYIEEVQPEAEALEEPEDLGKTAIFTIPKSDAEITNEQVADEELPEIDVPEIDLETEIPEIDLGADIEEAEVENVEDEKTEMSDTTAEDAVEELEADITDEVEEAGKDETVEVAEPEQESAEEIEVPESTQDSAEEIESTEIAQEESDNSINLDIHSTRDLSAKVEVISGIDWQQPEYEKEFEEEEQTMEEQEIASDTPERTSEGELLNRILNKNSEDIPEPELVATEEELSVFKNFFNVEGLEDNIQEVVKELIAGYTPNGKSTDGNVIILGEEKTGKTSLAVEIIKLVNKKRGRRNRRLAKIDATALNKRGFRNSLNKLLGSDLIIENADKLGAMILSEVVDVSGMFTDDMLIILEGETEPMEKMLSDSPRLSKVFNHVIRIKQYDINEWVEYGKRYAGNKGYVMEELAGLAFYKAIDDYFGEHKGIGRADVEKIVDKAISNSHKLGRKLSGLFSSNKNDDGLYILIESDFIF